MKKIKLFTSIVLTILLMFTASTSLKQPQEASACVQVEVV